jgi:FkbM family methyltransferase
VTIKNGELAGYQWKRSHKYVNGYWLGIYEMPIQECLARELRPGDVFYDIGANAGFFYLLGSRCVDSNGQVFAFEPLAENAQTIRQQLTLNDVTNCTVVEAAVTDHVGQVQFFEGSECSTGHLGREEATRGMKSIVRAITLDAFTKTAPAPNFVKVDVEGAEALLLKGAQHLLKADKPPTFLVEVHGEKLEATTRQILERQGYRIRYLKYREKRPDNAPRHILAFPDQH